jgi:RimJ/RimL family protein N-acetyltransferase
MSAAGEHDRGASLDPLGQPIGPPVPGWKSRPKPPRSPIEGRLVRIEALSPERHVADLFAAFREDREGRVWTYLPYGPFETLAAYRAFVEAECLGEDPLFHAIVLVGDERPAGVAAYLRVDREFGVVEVGHICYAPVLQRTPAATEAMYLLMRRAFDELGYRRYEWKCDALNARSRAAAERLGFRFEGVFRQATIYKGRNRDTAWFSVIDRDWPAVKVAFDRWLDPANFDGAGRQRRRLAGLRPSGPTTPPPAPP